ncbi:MAG: TonB-dependent receptor, partial [Paracoccaceae bacterium]
RNFLAFADTVPGMTFSTDDGGNTRLRSGAQTGSAINVFIDGVGQKNYVLPGGITGQDTSRGNPFPQSAIGEYKVITQNYKAEYDQLSSAAIVAVTRSGSNKFTGNAFYDFTDTDLRSRSFFEQRDNYKAISEDKQYGVSFGGPIIADRAHFFLAYEAKEIKSPVTFNLGHNYTINQLPPEFQTDYGSGVYTRPFKEDLWFGKVDWLFGEDHYFELTAKYRQETELVQVGGQDLPSHSTDNTNDETRVDLRYQYTFGDWLNDAHLTYEKAFWSPRPHEFSNGYVISDGNWYETIAHRGGGENYQDKGQKGEAFQDDLTFRGWDDHTIKLGLKFKSVTVDTLEQNKFNPQFFYDIHESLTVPIHVEFGAPVSTLGDGTVTSKNKQFGIYIQDDWQASERLMLNLGIRWDVESTPSFEDYVTPANVVTALQNSSANQSGSGVVIADYISTGNNRSSDKNNWAPRIGFSYDTLGDQRHVLFGGIGRSYDRNLFDYLQLEVSKGSWGNFAYNFNTPGHPCVVGVDNCVAYNPAYQDPEVLRASAVAGSGAGREVFLTDNNLQVPYSDQFSFGMRNIFNLAGRDWTSEVTLSRVVSHDGFVFLLGNRLPNGSFFPNPGDSDPSPFGRGFAPFGNMILGTNGQKTHANSLLVRLDKPFTEESHWGVTIAYTYTDADQNSNINGFPFALNRASINDYGSFPALVSRSRVVATGIVDGPWGVTYSAKATFASALPRYIQDCNEASWSQCHADSYVPDNDFKQLDLAASKEWEVFGDVKLRFRADVLNVFNWANYSGYDDWRGAPNEALNPHFGQPTATQFPTRTLKLSVGVDW